jgi:hypothetical protein
MLVIQEGVRPRSGSCRIRTSHHGPRCSNRWMSFEYFVRSFVKLESQRIFVHIRLHSGLPVEIQWIQTFYITNYCRNSLWQNSKSSGRDLGGTEPSSSNIFSGTQKPGGSALARALPSRKDFEGEAGSALRAPSYRQELNLKRRRGPPRMAALCGEPIFELE